MEFHCINIKKTLAPVIYLQPLSRFLLFTCRFKESKNANVPAWGFMSLKKKSTSSSSLKSITRSDISKTFSLKQGSQNSQNRKSSYQPNRNNKDILKEVNLNENNVEDNLSKSYSSPDNKRSSTIFKLAARSRSRHNLIRHSSSTNEVHSLPEIKDETDLLVSPSLSGSLHSFSQPALPDYPSSVTKEKTLSGKFKKVIGKTPTDPHDKPFDLRSPYYKNETIKTILDKLEEPLIVEKRNYPEAQAIKKTIIKVRSSPTQPTSENLNLLNRENENF